MTVGAEGEISALIMYGATRGPEPKFKGVFVLRPRKRLLRGRWRACAGALDLPRCSRRRIIGAQAGLVHYPFKELLLKIQTILLSVAPGGILSASHAFQNRERDRNEKILTSGLRLGRVISHALPIYDQVSLDPMEVLFMIWTCCPR